MLEQREQLHTLVVNALTALVDEHAQATDYQAALAANRRLLGLEPWTEPVHRQQMLLLAQTSDRAAAIAQYEACQRILTTEFGVAPLPETTALYAQIRAGEIGRQGDKVSSPESAVNRQPSQVPSWDEQRDLGVPTLVAGHNLPQRVKLYGRQAELASLQKWIGEEGCRLVGVFGIGGQCGFALAATLVRTLAEAAAQPPPRPEGTCPQIGGETVTSSTPSRLPPQFGEGPRGHPGGVGFTRILWRSLLNAPPLAEVLQEWFYVLSDQTAISLPASLDQQFAQLLDYLRYQRCLLVLDNLESILQGNERGGYYRPGYEGYGQLLRCVVEGEHRSCLLLTSREWPKTCPTLRSGSDTLAPTTFAAGTI